MNQDFNNSNKNFNNSSFLQIVDYFPTIDYFLSALAFQQSGKCNALVLVTRRKLCGSVLSKIGVSIYINKFWGGAKKKARGPN